MTSLETLIWNPEGIGTPSILPPLPMVMLRNDCAQKSMAHLKSMRAGSMSRRRRPRLASSLSS